MLYSADKVVTKRGADLVDDAIPVEYLNTLEATGLPPGNLHLKIGCPLILLQNLTLAVDYAMVLGWFCYESAAEYSKFTLWVEIMMEMLSSFHRSAWHPPQLVLSLLSACNGVNFQCSLLLQYPLTKHKDSLSNMLVLISKFPSSATDSCTLLSPMRQVVVMSKSSFQPEPLLCIRWMLYTQRSSNFMILKLCNHLQQLDYAHVHLYSTISRNWTWLCESNCHQHIHSLQR